MDEQLVIRQAIATASIGTILLFMALSVEVWSWLFGSDQAKASAARVERTVRSPNLSTLERTSQRPFAAAHGWPTYSSLKTN